MIDPAYILYGSLAVSVLSGLGVVYLTIRRAEEVGRLRSEIADLHAENSELKVEMRKARRINEDWRRQIL